MTCLEVEDLGGGALGDVFVVEDQPAVALLADPAHVVAPVGRAQSIGVHMDKLD